VAGILVKLRILDRNRRGIGERLEEPEFILGKLDIGAEPQAERSQHLSSGAKRQTKDGAGAVFVQNVLDPCGAVAHDLAN
jgi:hypothetical protein